VAKLVVGRGGRFGLALTLVMLATWLGAGPGLAMPQGRAVAHELIVGFRHGASALERRHAVQAVDGKVERRLHGIGASLIRVPGRTRPAADRLERRGAVRYAEPNFVLSVDAAPDDPDFGQLWGLDNAGQLVGFSFGTPDADIDAPEAWDVTTGGGPVVGIVDTGIDMAHPDLAANVWRNLGESCAGCRTDGVDNDGNGYVDDWRGWDYANDDNDPSDDNGHGTHVAGTVGAVGDNGVGVAGVNWSARLMALKFIGADGNGTTADAIDALMYAADNGAAVTNNSYGGPELSQAFADAVAVADARGSLVVAAAGNNGSSNDATPQYPASFDSPNVVSVAATNNRDQRAWFSNYGASSVDLGAPGDSIYSTWPGGGYQTLSGTSMAAPQVAGAAALAEARFPGATPGGIKALLLRTVDPIPALAGKTASGGRLNVNSAVRCSGAGQAWIESPAQGFAAMPGEQVHVRALAGSCGGTAGLTLTATANGAPMTLSPRGDGSYEGDYTAAEAGPLSISVTAAGPGGADVDTVSGTVFALIEAGGPPVTVTASTPDENPRLAFEGSAGQRVSLALSGVTMGTSSCCGAKVSINGPDGSKLVAPTYFGTNGGFVDAVTLPRTGTYTILVDPQGTTTGSATLTLHDVPADATAPIEPDGPAASAQTSVPGQNAAFTFAGSSGERVSLKVGPLCCSARVSLVAPDGTTLGTPTVVSTYGGFIEPVALTQSGTYRVVVDLQGAATGSSTVTLYEVPPDLTGGIVPGGPAATVQTSAPGQNARLTFTGSAGQVVSLSTGPFCCPSKLSILGPDGSTVSGPTLMSAGAGFVDAMTLPKSGTYTIVLDPQGAATGSSTLSLFNVPADAAAAIAPGGAGVALQTTTPGQNARLTFTGVAGRRLSLNVAPTCCAASISIQAPDGSEVASAASLAVAPLFVEPWSLPQSGLYTIVVDPRAAAKGAMTFTLYDVPADLAPTASIGGPSLTLPLTTPGQNAAVAFNGTAGRTITLQLTGVTITQSKLTVLNPDGSTLVGAQYIFTSGKTLSVQLTQTGSHTVLLNPVGAYTGSATLSLR
jgi:hypothetical protein